MMEFIVEKIGMSRTVGATSKAVTLLRVINMKICEVLDDNTRVFVAYPKGKIQNKSILGIQKKYGLSKEFNKFLTLQFRNAVVGDVKLDVLAEAKRVKTIFNTKGRGFSGAVKRWGFQGGPAAHGSRFHRRVGSIGNREWPGRVQPGKKMAGQYGNDQVSAINGIFSFDRDSNILVVKGSVPGYNGAFGIIRIID